MCLFQLKMYSGKQFTPCHVFGRAWKIWSNRKLFPLTVKWACLKCKIDYRSILPTNHLWKKKRKKKKRTEPRERVRVRESRPLSERERPVTWTWDRLHRRRGRASHRWSSKDWLHCWSALFLSSSLFLPLPPMSLIYPFSLYPCRANHCKTSDPSWPSCLRRL